jgi:hypothetical protein
VLLMVLMVLIRALILVLQPSGLFPLSGTLKQRHNFPGAETASFLRKRVGLSTQLYPLEKVDSSHCAVVTFRKMDMSRFSGKFIITDPNEQYASPETRALYSILVGA